MATSSSKGLNEVIRGALLDEADGTIAKQITIVGTTADTGSLGSTEKSLNDAARGTFVNESDGTVARQVRFV